MSIFDYNNEFVAKNYDEIIDYSRRVRILKKILERLPFRYKNVLDLACGTGAVIDAIQAKPSIKVVGVDISSHMLMIAKMRFLHKKNIILRRENFIRVKFPPSTFDLVVIAHAIRYVSKNNERKFIENISSWLKPGGIFVVIKYDVIKIPLLTTIIKTLATQKKRLSSLNNEKTLIDMMGKRFILSDIYQSKILFHRSIKYFPSRIKAYYFLKKTMPF